MLERLSQFWQALTWIEIVVGTVGVILGFALSYAVVMVILVKMPANYFHSDYEHHFLPDSHPVLRTAGLVLKNIVGVLVIITGIILSFPGIPGPGLLTIFIGVMITDIPGKRKLEAKFIQRPAVLSAINKLRTKYKKPELIMD
jgi:hypothetical protein